VTAEAERLLEAAMKLPDAERAELAAILTDSIGDGHSDEETEAAWLDEAKRRLADFRSGKSQAVPSEDVEHELEQIIASHESKRAAG
jgi:putative addiction module component (TIGR02574 family)